VVSDKNILLIVPTEREAAFFAEHGLRAHICGVGMAECAAATAHLLAQRLSAGQRPDLVILAGIAGSYGDDLSVGDTVIVESETVADLGRRDHDGGFTPLFQKTYVASFVPEGFPTAHGNTVNAAGGMAVREVSLSRRDKATIENMEGAAFFAVCERFGVTAMEVRTISNRVGEPVTSEGLDVAARSLAADLYEIIGCL
jgi:nucleoside phosphorylase